MVKKISVLKIIHANKALHRNPFKVKGAKTPFHYITHGLIRAIALW